MDNNNDAIMTTLEYIKRDIKEIKADIKEIKEDYVSQAEFKPVKSLVYGLVSLTLTAVVGALLALVVK